MKKFNLKDFTKGWIIGNFEPNIVRTKEYEFLVRSYKKGDKEPRHVHKVAYEITVIINGKVKMNGEILSAGDILHLEPGDSSDFECLEDCDTAVVKAPSVIGDKYLV
jgi:quercetin dioxygenase-like cupin family protein